LVCLECGGDHAADRVVVSQVFLSGEGDFSCEFASAEESLEGACNTELICGVEKDGGFVLDNQIVDSSGAGCYGCADAHGFEQEGIERPARLGLNENVACSENRSPRSQSGDDGDCPEQVKGGKQLAEAALAGPASHYDDHELVAIEYHVPGGSEEILEVIDFVEGVGEDHGRDAGEFGETTTGFGDEGAYIDLLNSPCEAWMELGDIGGDGLGRDGYLGAVPRGNGQQPPSLLQGIYGEDIGQVQAARQLACKGCLCFTETVQHIGLELRQTLGKCFSAQSLHQGQVESGMADNLRGAAEDGINLASRRTDQKHRNRLVREAQ